MKSFPLIRDSKYDLEFRRGNVDVPYPDFVPWGLVEKCEEQVVDNHCGQSIKRLAERGGLHIFEMLVALKGERLFSDAYDEISKNSIGEAIELLNKEIETFENQHNEPS